MKRLPLAAYAALAVATVGAFFVTQHLKVSLPLVSPNAHPTPAIISPEGQGCAGAHRRVGAFSFYLLNRADNVAVYVVDASGTIVRTLASGWRMPRKVRTNFPWDGRENSGRLAPDGSYHFRIVLLEQNRTVDYTRVPVTVKSSPPHPVVSGVSPALLARGGGPVQIHYSGTEQRAVTVQIYRTDLPGRPRLVKRFRAGWRGANWDVRIRQRPAPAGTYLVGLEVQDAACNIGRFLPTLPASPGSAAQATLTVR